MKGHSWHLRLTSAADKPEHSGAAREHRTSLINISQHRFTEVVRPMHVEDDCRIAIFPAREVQNYRHRMDDDHYSANFPEPGPDLRSLVWHKHRSSAW